jgi:hypothetical protein
VSRRWGRDQNGSALGDVLGRTQAFRRAPLPPGLPVAWDTALGPAARHTKLRSLRGGTLTVITGEPAWTPQIEGMATGLVSRLREAGFSVDRLIVQGPRKKLR